MVIIITINAIAVNDRIIASASKDRTIRLWDLTTGERLKILNACSPVIFTKNGRYLITGNQKHQL